MDQRSEVREFIAQRLRRKGDLAPFTDSESLILAGRLESVDAVEIVMFLERRFAVDFGAIGFDQAELDSVDLIVALVTKRAAAGAD